MNSAKTISTAQLPYGALEIKRFIKKNTFISFGNALILFSSLFAAWFAISTINEIKEDGKTKIPRKTVPTEVMDIIPTTIVDIKILPSEKIEFATIKIAGNPIASIDMEIIKKEYAGWDELQVSGSSQDGVLIDDITKFKNDFDEPKTIKNIAIPVQKNENDDDYTFVEVEPVIDFEALLGSIVYPEMARKLGIEGRVTVSTVIGIDGRVKSSKIISSASKMLEAAALEAVNKIVCVPAIQNGKPVECRVAIPVQFKLK